MSSAAHHFVTEEEFLSLPESPERVELLDGEVFLAPSPTYAHQRLLRLIVRALEDWAALQGSPVTIGMAPLDVRFAPGRILQPDAFVLFGAVSRAQEGPIEAIPAVCIEVLSRNRVFDRVTKRLVYAEAGVAELWTVEADGSVERWSGEGLGNTELFTGAFQSDAVPGFELDLALLR